MAWNKYGYMSTVNFQFAESNLPLERLKELPVIPIVIAYGDKQQEIISALLDSGSTNSFIDVQYAKLINGQIIDVMKTSGVTSLVENKPVIEVRITNKSMEGKWVNMKVAVIDTHHPNYNIILGRDFMELFKEIKFDFENKVTTLKY